MMKIIASRFDWQLLLVAYDCTPLLLAIKRYPRLDRADMCASWLAGSPNRGFHFNLCNI